MHNLHNNKTNTDNSDWNLSLLKAFDNQIANIAEKYKLDIYPNQIEIISAEQMIDAYSSIGLPISYNHWSFGKQYFDVEKIYKRGDLGLAYELVINSSPCISYLLDENSLVLQALVIAHACYGHNSFFKGNYLFKTYTNANNILSFLSDAKKYIHECEEKYGIDKVEKLLDAAHSLKNYGIDKYKSQNIASNFTNLSGEEIFNQENILHFIELNAKNLKSWERKIISIIRKISEYFYPQRQTKVMNEGWACFWHYLIINEMFDNNKLSQKFMLKFMHHHTNLIYQPVFSDPNYTEINPYALGFKMFQDIKRICDTPTKEDFKYFPDIANTNWLKTFDFIMQNYKDESFINQFLSPKLIRDLKLFAVLDHENQDNLIVTDIHNNQGYQNIKTTLANQLNGVFNEPDIAINNALPLKLSYNKQLNKKLNLIDAKLVIKYLQYLWRDEVFLIENNNAAQIII